MRLLVVSCAPVVSSFTLSLACLLLTAITVHDTCDCDGPFPLVIVQSAPFYPSVSVSLSLSSVFHTQSHMLTLLLISLFVFTLPTCQLCCDVFPCRAPSCPSPSVMSEFWWNLTSRPSGDDMPDESLNQYLPVFLLSLSFFSLCSIVFPPSPCCEHSTSAPPPAALVQQCSGGTWGPSGSQGLWDGSLHPPSSHVQPPRAVSRGQPN